MCDLATSWGYDVPADTSPLARKVLAALRQWGRVVYTCDDGISLAVYQELLDIVAANDLSCWGEYQRLTLVDIYPHLVFDGSSYGPVDCDKLGPVDADLSDHFS